MARMLAIFVSWARRPRFARYGSAGPPGLWGGGVPVVKAGTGAIAFALRDGRQWNYLTRLPKAPPRRD
jgi:hypothetical protein